MLTFSEAGDRLHQEAVKIQLERQVSYQQAFQVACAKDAEATLIYFQNPQTRRKYLETPAQAEAKEREEKLRQKEWQMASDKLTRLANERVTSGLAKDFSEGFEQARRANSDFADIYDRRGGES